MKYAKTLGAVIGCAGLLTVSMPASATLAVQLTNQGVTSTCNDNDACDSNSAVGIVNATLNTGSGTATISVGGIGSGAPILPALDLDLTWNLTSGSTAPAGTYTIAVSQNNLAVTYPISFTGTAAGTQNNGATTAWNNYAAGSNVLFDLSATNFCSAGPTAANPVNLSCSSPVFTGGASVVSLTSVITIVAHAGSTSATGDAHLVRTVPEPATLGLLGLALAGVGFAVRRKQA